MPRRCLALLALLLPLGADAQQPKPRHESAPVKAVIRNVAFSPDGKSVALGVWNSARLWDVAAGKQTPQFDSGEGVGIAAAFAPDGKAVVTTSGANGRLFVWDLPGGKRRLILDRDAAPLVHHVAWSPDGKRIASAGASFIVWDAATGKRLHAWPARAGGCSVVFSLDGKRLLASDHAGSVSLFDPANGKTLRTWRPGGVVAGLAFSPDGRLVYTGGTDGRLREFDDGTKLREWATGKGVARTLATSPDGRTLAVATEFGTAQLWELATLKQRRTFRADKGFVWSVAFAPDGKSVATGGDEGVARVWDVTDGWAEPDADKKKPRTAEQLEALWKDLGGNADVAFTAVWALAGHAKQSVPFLAKKLEAAQPAPSAKDLARLIEKLDDDDFDEREGASLELSKGGATARAALAAAAKGQLSLEQRKRIARLLIDLRDAKLSAGELVVVRAAEALAKIDSDEARRLMAKLGAASKSR